MYFKRIKGNVKGGCDVEIGRLTLISGVNGSGKSTIINTLELAATKEASDIVGRPVVKRGLDLLALGPPEETLTAWAETDTGKSCSLTIERAGVGKGREPQHEPLPGIKVEYPIRAALEALRGDVNKAQAFVLKHAGLKVTDKAAKKSIDEELHDLYDTFALSHDDKPQGIPRLRAIQEDAAKIARSSNAAVTKAQALIDSLAASLPLTEPTDEEIEQAKVAVRDANTKHGAAAALPEKVDVDALKARAMGLIQQTKDAEKQVNAVKAIAEQAPDPGAQIRLSLIPLLNLYVSRGGSTCVLCETGRVAGTPEDVKARIAQIQEKLKGQTERAQAQAMLPSLSTRLATLRTQATTAIQAFQAAQSAQATETLVDRQAELVAAYAELQAAEANLRSLTQVKGQWSTIGEARKRLRESKKQAEQAGELAEACTKVLRLLTKKSRAAFVSKVQKYLPVSDCFDLELTQGKRNVCLFGFRVGSDLHTALSGAEWARLTIALGAACMKEGDSVLSVLTPEERAFDPETLRSVMAALVNAPGQVLLTSPIGPSAEVEGWVHLRVE